MCDVMGVMGVMRMKSTCIISSLNKYQVIAEIIFNTWCCADVVDNG